LELDTPEAHNSIVTDVVTLKEKKELQMSAFIDAVVLALQVVGVAAIVYGLFLKLHSDIAPAKTTKGLASGN
jgi:hypothetical protein